VGRIDVTDGGAGNCVGTEVGSSTEVSPDPGPEPLLLLGGDGLTPEGTVGLGPTSEIVGPEAGGLFGVPPPVGDGLFVSPPGDEVLICPPLPALIDECEEREGDFGSRVMVPDPL
jgi:hypothetical protein